MPDDSVQLHLTSIPYNVGKYYGDSDTINRRRHHFYLGFMLQTLSEMTRTLAPGGVLFLQVGSTRIDDGGLMPLDCVLLEHLRAMGLTYQNRVVWTILHGLTPRAPGRTPRSRADTQQRRAGALQRQCRAYSPKTAGQACL